MYVKTKTVSKQLNVNPSTIQRWVKHFDLPYHKNNHGHLLFTEADIEQLKQIKDQLNSGLSMEDIKLTSNNEDAPGKTDNNRVTMTEYEKRLDELVEKTNQIETKLSQKADEVVSVRLYQHRSELDDLLKTITKAEERIETIETQLADFKTNDEQKLLHEKKPKRNWLVSLFST